MVYRNNDGEVTERPIATVDHVVQLSDGGTNLDDNIALACKKCNNDREYVQHMRKKDEMESRSTSHR